MTNKKLKHASFNLRLMRVIEDNWRFLSGICITLEREFGWRQKRLEGWMSRATEYVTEFNEHDRDGIYANRLQKLEREQGGGAITRGRVTEFVAKHTTLTVPYEINEIVDNVLLELLMTAAEFKISRKGLMSGYEKLTREDLDGAGEHLQKEYGIELERGFFDYYSILANRQRTKKKISWQEEKEAKKALAAFRAWSAENNPGEGEIMNNE